MNPGSRNCKGLFRAQHAISETPPPPVDAQNPQSPRFAKDSNASKLLGIADSQTPRTPRLPKLPAYSNSQTNLNVKKTSGVAPELGPTRRGLRFNFANECTRPPKSSDSSDSHRFPGSQIPQNPRFPDSSDSQTPQPPRLPKLSDKCKCQKHARDGP